MKIERWSFLAETKEAAIDLLTKQQKMFDGRNTMSAEDYSSLIKTIDNLDLTMPPPLAQDEVIADGWHWIVKVSYTHEEYDIPKDGPPEIWHYFHEWTATREAIVYGLYRRVE